MPRWLWRPHWLRRRLRRTLRPRHRMALAPCHTSPSRGRTASVRHTVDVEGMVHDRGWRTVRCLQSDRGQHERRDDAVRGHRRLDLHRPADTRHDLHRAGGRGQRHVLSGDQHGQVREVQAGRHVRDRSGSQRRAGPGPAGAPDSDGLRLYARLDASVNGNGGGGAGNGGADSAVVDNSTGQPVPVAYDTNTSSNAANRDYAVPLYAALRADRPFTAVGVGFAGAASDGLSQLDAAHTLSTPYDSAVGGNVTTTVGLDLGPGRSAQLALGFASSQAQAVQTAGRALESRSTRC